MPHPKNRLKLTGDTHLPDPRLDFMAEDEPMEPIVFEEEPRRVYADGYEPSPAAGVEIEPEHPSRVAALERTVEEFPARSPWLAIGVALAFGWLVAKMLKR